MEPSQWRQYDIRVARHSGTIHEANGVFPVARENYRLNGAALFRVLPV